MKNQNALMIYPLITIFVLVFSVNVFAVEYYIDPVNGDDGKSGTIAANAWKTLGRAFRIGDDKPSTLKETYGRDYSQSNPCLVYLMNGTHITNSSNEHESVWIMGSWITVMNYPGHNPRIYVNPKQAYTQYRATAVRTFYSADHITLNGIDIEGGVSFALKIDENCNNVTVKNCKIHGSGADCVKLVGEDAKHDGNTANQGLIMEYNEIYDSGIKSSFNAEGIDACAISNATIRNNYFHDIKTTGMYFKGNCDNILVENNFLYNVGTVSNTTKEIYDTYGGIYLGECMDQQYIPPAPNNYECMNSIVRNNIIAFCGGPALRAMGAYNCQFLNNTVFNLERTYSSWYDYVDSGAMHVVTSCSGSPPREQNKNVAFKYNLVIDSCKQGYPRETYQNPIVNISSGSWVSGESTATSLALDNNIYFREQGDYRFVDDTQGISVASHETWKSQTEKDKNSIIASPTNDLIAIRSNPALPRNKASSYERGNDVPANIGANANYVFDGTLQKTESPTIPDPILLWLK